MPRDPATHVGAVVLVDDVEIPCDADSLDPGVLSGLRVTWGREDRLAVPAATTVDFQLADPPGGTGYADVVAFNSTVEVLAEAPDGTRNRVFYGIVSDLKLVNDATDAVVSVTAIDPSAALSGISTGAEPWPAQTADQRRLAIRAALPANTVIMPTIGSAQNISGSTPVAAKDVDNQTAADIIHTFYWGLGLVPYPTTWETGTTQKNLPTYKTAAPLEVHKDIPAADTRENRRIPVAALDTVPAAGTGAPVAIRTVIVEACDVDLDGTEFTANPADGVQAVRVTYGPSDDQRTYVLPIPESLIEAAAGRRFEVTSDVDVYPTESIAHQYAMYVAQNWYSQMANWNYDFDAPWSVGALRLDPDTVTGMDDFHLAMLLLLQQSDRIHANVLLQNLPTWTPWRRGTRSSSTYPPHQHCPHVVGELLGGTYTFDAGRWVLDLHIAVERALQTELAPAAPILVRPGDQLDIPHDTEGVTPDPTTRWAVGEIATFTDGAYGWDGTAWIAGGVKPILAAPGATLDVAHDDDRVRATPATAWTAGQYAAFTDGPYRWTGSAWTAVTVVGPSSTVDLAHDDDAVQPNPVTAWAEDEYATFTDGTWRWDGTAWVVYIAPIVVTPGSTLDVAHDTAGVTPEPATAWGEDEYATFTDGTWRWDGSAWVVYVPSVEPWPGESFDVATTDPMLVSPGVPAARWPWDGTLYTSAKFTDGVFAWRESAGNPQGYWAQVFNFSANTATTAPKWIPVPHDDPMVRAPMAAADGVVALFTDGPFEVDGTALAWVPTDRIGYDGATVPYTHDDPAVVAIPQVPWPTTTDEARGRRVPYVTFTDGTYLWDGATWVTYPPTPRDTTWAGAPEGTAWNDVPAGTSWNDWTGEV